MATLASLLTIIGVFATYFWWGYKNPKEFTVPYDWLDRYFYTIAVTLLCLHIFMLSLAVYDVGLTFNDIDREYPFLNMYVNLWGFVGKHILWVLFILIMLIGGGLYANWLHNNRLIEENGSDEEQKLK